MAVADEDLALWRLLRRAQARIAHGLEADLLARHGLPLSSYDVLAHLAEAGGRLRMNDLADRMLLSRSGVTRLIDRLQREDLVVREACPEDARGLFAALTEAGARRLAEAAPTYRDALRARLAEAFGPRDAAERARCTALLARLAVPRSGPDAG